VKLTVRVPATVANLGPGFDCFALALSLFNEVTLDTEADPAVRVEGEGAGEIPEDESNLVVRAMRRLTRKARREPPVGSITCVNNVPLERGLGSSAAAVVAGVLLAQRALDLSVAPKELLETAHEMEGHLDNVGAALHGGITLVYKAWADETWKTERLDPHPDLRPVVLLNEAERVSTQEARLILPEKVPFEDAVFNASRSALLVLALTSRPDLLGEALRDTLHQGPRLFLAPASSRLFMRLIDRGIPVCVAGSGPSLLAFEREDKEIDDPGPGWRVIRTEIAGGAEIVED
jgi:homoserine kinase